MATNPIGDSVTTTISFPKKMHREATARAEKLKFRSFSAYVQRLIGDDLMKRGRLIVQEDPPRQELPTAPPVEARAPAGKPTSRPKSDQAALTRKKQQ